MNKIVPSLLRGRSKDMIRDIGARVELSLVL